jgi:hypothetical protein
MDEHSLRDRSINQLPVVARVLSTIDGIIIGIELANRQKCRKKKQNAHKWCIGRGLKAACPGAGDIKKARC